MRAWGPGAAPLATLSFAAAFAGPLACAAFVGLAWRRYVLIVVAVVALSASLAETQATVEEWWFVQQHRNLPASAKIVFHDRWWPNASSYLYFDPATGQLGGSD